MNLYIARDKSGELFLYHGKPLRDNKMFAGAGAYGMIRLREDLFPEVTFENSPQEVELKLVKDL